VSAAAGRESSGARFKAELLLALEVLALCGLAFTRPVLDSYGRSPEAFIARDASAVDVVLFALVVALLPATLVAAFGALSGLAGPRARTGAQVAVVGALGGLAAWRFQIDVTSWPARIILPLTVLVGVGLTAARWRLPTTRTFLRYLGVASVLFVLQFLLLSPSSELVRTSNGTEVDQSMTQAVLDGTDGDPPPIVMLIVDALPTVTLLDGEGRINPDLYPNLASLASDATWYRNFTTLSAWTFESVPALLTGQRPGDELPDTRRYPDNFFTLFAGTHQVHAVEQITRLCPAEICPRSEGSALSLLVGDAIDWWRTGIEPEIDEGAQALPGALESDRDDEFEAWLGQQDFTAATEPGGDPGLWFYHLVLPHAPWYLLDDGTHYETVGNGDEEYGQFLQFWAETGVDVARQRHVLQAMATDALLGGLLDELRTAGTYDDALVVVVSDHGEAFVPDHSVRGVSEAQFEQVMWTPLLVKAPGQTAGAVDDTNVQGMDLMPIIASELGIDLPWEVEGMPPEAAASERDAGVKYITPNERHELDPDEDTGLVSVDAREGFRRVLEGRAVEPGGPDAPWRRTDHGDLVGQPVEGLVVRDEPAGRLEIAALDRIEQPGGDSLLLEHIGHTDLALDEVVAIAVGGVVVAVAPTSPSPGPEPDVVAHALLHPAPFGDRNEVSAYRVSGEPGSEVLHPLEVTGR
jgi:hypothetical protein